MASAALNSRRFPASLLLAPQVLLLFVFFAIPMGFIMFASLHSTGGVWTADNYAQLLGDPYYRLVLGRTFAIGIAVTMLTLLLGYPLARVISLSSGRNRALLRALVFFPLLTSSVIRTFGWLVLLSDNGVLNNVLGFVHVPPVHLLFNAAGVTIGLTQVLLPFMVLTLANTLQNLNPHWEEAARSLGSSGWRTFLRVTLPLSVPGIVAGSLLVFALSISAFVTPQLMGGVRTMVMGTLIYKDAIETVNWQLASAASTVLLLITMLTVGLYSALTRGAVTQASAAGE